MKKAVLILFFFIPVICSGQEDNLKRQRQENNLEKYIYSVLDEFLSNPSEENLKSLPGSFWRKPENDAEKLASVVLLCNRAYYENRFGKTFQAVDSYEKAWKTFSENKLKDYDIIEFCLKPLGNLYIILGDYDNAENTIKQYYFIANQQKNQSQKIAAVLNLSNVYQSSGKVETAIELLENILRTEKTSSTQKGKILNNLGASYIGLRNWTKAKTALETGIGLLQKDKNESEPLSNSFRNLASVYSELNENEKAAYYFEKARLVFLLTPNPEPRKQAKLYYDKALFLYRQGKFSESKQEIQAVFKKLIADYNARSSIPEKKSLYAETVLLDALDLQAKLFSEEKQYEKALETYSLSLHVETLFAPLFVYENTKLLTQIRNRKRTEKCLAIYENLYKKTKNQKWIESAFLLSEVTKSNVLKEHISRSKTISPKEKLLQKQFQDWNNVIVNEQQKFENADVSKINEAIKKQNELAVLLKSIRSKSTFVSEEISLEKLYSKLKNDDAEMVSYFAGFDKIYSFSVKQNSVKMNVFDKESYNRILNFVSYFDSADKITNDISGYRKSGFEIYKLLQLPQKTNPKNLIIIPDGLLNFVPFEALLTANSTSSDFSKMPYLLNGFRVAYNNSVAFYVDENAFRFEKENILGIFPVFENSPLELPFSKEELKAIRGKFDGNYLENKDANFRNFRNQASAFSILHLSTHADAGDLETPAGIRFSDREVLYSELYNLDIHPDLVVLSACETGIGKLYKGEGAMSVARGFQFAGARNLLFSLWKVNDFTTSVQMSGFYKNIKNGYSYFESSHNSKTDYLNSEKIPNAKKSPYYWGAMVYYGTLEPKPNANYLYYFSLLLIPIALFLIFRKFRKKNGKVAGTAQKK